MKISQKLTVLAALTAATTICRNLTLVTRNVRDFAELNVPLLNPFSDSITAA